MNKRTVRTLNYRRPYLYPKQEAAIFALVRIVIIEATTKSGKTLGCLAWLIEQAVKGRLHDVFWWVAPVAAQAYMAFKRAQAMLPRGMVRSISRTNLTITLVNGTIVWFKSGDSPDALYGEDVRAAVIDEAPRCKQATWVAVRSTLTATRGAVRIIGNVKGRRNWAFKLARKAESGAADMHYARLTADDAVEAGILHATEIESAREQLPEAVFRELYYAEASDDQGNPFGFDAIKACVGPLSGAAPFVWGWDLAKSRDWTVGIALDEDGRVCRLERFQRPWPDTMETIAYAIGSTPTLIDSTGVGDPVVEQLQRVPGTYVQPYHFSAPSKQQLMQGLAMAIQRKRIQVVDGPLVDELEAFEYEYTATGVRYAAPEGMHDDCVCALALAARLYITETEGGPPLELITGRDLAEEGSEPATGSDIDRWVRRYGCWFPSDWH